MHVQMHVYVYVYVYVYVSNHLYPYILCISTCGATIDSLDFRQWHGESTGEAHLFRSHKPI